MNFAAFVMAGGTGTRFWPASRRDSPKQLLSIGNYPVMIQETLNRLTSFLDPDNVFVITADNHAEKLRRTIRNVPDQNIIVEPEGRDTAACAALSGLITKKRFNEETVVGLFPADHRIPDSEQFESAVRQAQHGADQTEGIVCFGVKPDRPATGYGYILPAESSPEGSGELREVRQFTEKPDRNRASQLIEEDGALWNSGMFFWSASTILRETERHLPELYDGLIRIEDEWNTSGSLSTALQNQYSTLPATSVDYGIIERTDNIWTLPVDFHWNDLGTWESVDDLLETDDRGNGRSGDVITVDVEDSVLVNRDGPTLGAIGLEDMVVVATPDAVLICPKARTQDVKKLVKKLEETGRDELL